MTKLDPIPDWVPECIRHQAESDLRASWEPPLTPNRKKVLRRLLVDERMRGVWDEVFRKKRTLSYGKTDDFVHEPVRDPQGFDDLHRWTRTRQELAAMEFFSTAFLHTGGGRLVTVAERKGFARLLNKGAKDLRETARLFHAGLGDAGESDEQYASDLEKIAAHVDSLAKYHLSQTAAHVTAKRNRGEGELRAFIVHLAQLTTSLFGKNLYGTLAVVAAVGLNREVNAGQVRQILSG
jgi:hypothetical protein